MLMRGMSELVALTLFMASIIMFGAILFDLAR